VGSSASGIITGVAAGTTTISYILANGCYKTTTATVNTSPATISGADHMCLTKTATYTNTTPGGTWSSASSALTISASSGLATSVSAGSSLISYNMPGGCRATKLVNVAPLPAAITGTTGICQGTNTTLTSATPSLTWASSNGTVATVNTATPTTGTVTSGTPGVATISYTSAAGCTQTINVTVYATPDTIAGDNSL
ncbi:Ig-like domain-containing protein, partial [Nemorincola caseinilytica]|uniref:Ig-like domain-containing protein n=1 Tax=Nemorincola caseinilytica TaxID=2054315 RepID=UPI0031E94D9D